MGIESSNSFSNSLGGDDSWLNYPTNQGSSIGYSPAPGFGLQQPVMPSFSGFGGNMYTPTTSWGQNAMGSNNSQLAIGSNPYQAASPDWFSMGGAFGNGQTGGWAMPAIQGLQSLFSWQQGNKALSLARDQFNFSKDITQKNLANQTSLLNTAMQDRQNARRSASSSYQDTGSYMDERGL